MEAPVAVTAEDIAGRLAAAKLPVRDVVSVTAESDDNHLLGRPGQYTSKVFFYDGRHPKRTGDDEGENTIEAFNNPIDAKRRHDYVDAMTKDMPMLLQYQYLEGNVLLRLHKVLTPAEAKAYQTALTGMK